MGRSWRSTSERTDAQDLRPHRTHGDFVLGGQWFPKIGVFEDAGDRGRAEAGWNTHQFHANSEFFADFGDCDVSLRLPARYAGRIGATGRLLEETIDGDPVTALFAQRGVHDFAWTASPEYLVVDGTSSTRTPTCRPSRPKDRGAARRPPGRAAAAARGHPLMLQPAHRSQAERYIEAARRPSRLRSARSAPTPGDPDGGGSARGGLGAAGMEYPTFITLGTHPLLGAGFRRGAAPEGSRCTSSATTSSRG